MIEPIVWETYGSVVIRELGNEDIDKLVQFVISCQLDELLVYPREKRQLYETYKNFYKFALGKRESLIAVDRESDEVIGVIICLIMTNEMKSWINLRLMADEPHIKTIFNLFHLMICEAQALQPSHQPIDSLLVLRIAVPRYNKGRNWKPRLLNAVSKMAACLKMPCIIHFAFSKNDQTRSERAGMKEQVRIYYLQYIDPETRKRPFRLIKQDELCVILYKKEIKKIIPYYDVKGTCTHSKKKKSSRRYYIPSVPSYISSLSGSSCLIRFMKSRPAHRSRRRFMKEKSKEKSLKLEKKRVATRSFNSLIYL